MTSHEPSPDTPGSPERSAAPPLERALRYDAVNELWQKTKDIYYAHHRKDDMSGEWGVDDNDLYNAEVAEAIRTHLATSGLEESDEEAVKLGRRLRGMSFDRMNTRRWKYGDWVDRSDRTKGLKPGTSGESRVRNLQLAFTGRDLEEEAREAAYAAEDEEHRESGPPTPERLLELRKAKHDALVNKLKGPAFGKKRKQLQAAYEAAEADYLAAYMAFSKATLDDKKAELVSGGMSEDDAQAEVAAFMKSSTERTAKEDRDLEHKLLVEKSGWLGRQMERYANLSKGKKVLVGLGLSGLALASGVGVGVLAGMAGGLIGAGAATGASVGLLRGWGAMRTYHLRKAELFKRVDSVPEMTVTSSDMGDLLDTQKNYLHGLSSDVLQNGERIKKRAVVWTLGSVAVGGAAGVFAHGLLAGEGAGTHWPGGQLQHWLEEKWHMPWEQASGKSGGILPHDPDTTPPSKPPDTGGGTETVKRTVTELKFSKTGTVPDGRGIEDALCRSLKESGVNPKGIDMHDLQDYLTRLHGKDGFFTHDSNIRTYTFNHDGGTPDVRIGNDGQVTGKWNRDIIDDIDKYLKAHGRPGLVRETHTVTVPVEHHTTGSVTRIGRSDFGSVRGGVWGQSDTTHIGRSDFDTSALSTPQSSTPIARATERVVALGDNSPVNVIQHGDGWDRTFNELRDAGVVDIPRGDYDKFLSTVGPELHKIHYSNGVPVATHVGRFGVREWVLNEPPFGNRMPPEAIRLITQFAERKHYALAA